MKRPYQARLNRQRSGLRLKLFPIASVMLASAIPMLLPYIASMPLLPPMGFLVLLAWRLLRPGLWPVWTAGLFGAFDDLFSGQPFGSAIFLWSVAMIIMELIDSRYVWRVFWQDLFVTGIFLLSYIGLMALINLIFKVPVSPVILLPQIILSICLFPLILRGTAWVDSKRLLT